MAPERGRRERLKQQPVTLMTQFTHDMLKQILEKARKQSQESRSDMGDLIGTEFDFRDNAALLQAVYAASFTLQQVGRLEFILDKPTIIEPRQQTDVIGVGNTIVIRREGESEQETLTLLSPNDASMRDGWISYLSPVGAALIGKKSGDAVILTVDKESTTVNVLDVLPGQFEGPSPKK